MTEVQETPTPSRTRRRLLWLAAALVIAPPATFGAGWARFEWVVRPRVRAAAGFVELGRLDTDVPASTILPPATGPGNAATFYVAALDAYQAHRQPFAAGRLLAPIAYEPPVDDREAATVVVGAHQRDCDLYAQAGGRPALAFHVTPGGTPWEFSGATDPFAQRPYIPVFRVLAQAVLNRGKVLERQKRLPQAIELYQAVARMGWHLRRRPGCLLDVSLALEIERRAVHYMDAFYRLARDERHRLLTWRYGDALDRLDRRIRRKYVQVANPEAAKEVLRSDPDPVWRTEAAFALATVLHVRPLDWYERRSVMLALRSARRDPNHVVRAVASLLLRMPRAQYRSGETGRDEGGAEGAPQDYG